MRGIVLTAMTLGVAPPALGIPLSPPPIRLDAVLARAQTAKGKRTIYENMSVPPSEKLAVWPRHRKSDCSGFVGWCFGLPRKPRLIGEDTKLGTDQIYDDAVRDAGNRLFASTNNPMVGDIIVYPNYWSAPGRGDSGHVALLTGKEASGRFSTIECASTPYHDPSIGDAIASNRGEGIFIEHGRLMLEVRARYPEIPLKLTRPPIFARYLGLIR